MTAAAAMTTAATIPFSIPTIDGADPWKVTMALVWGLLPELEVELVLGFAAPVVAAALLAAGAAEVLAAGAAEEAAAVLGSAAAAEEELPPGFKTDETEGTVMPTLAQA